MTRFLLLAILVSSNAQAGELWDSLWHNADQRGERLLQQGKVAEAAKTYSDVRRKAYAQLQAGDFQNAAQGFASLNDSNANYNRGTALAHAGKLEESLKAFDAALAQDPQDKDAQRNRALVNKALKQQPPKKQSPSNTDSSSESKKPKDQTDSSKKPGGKNSEKKDNADKKGNGDKKSVDDKGQHSKDGSGGDNKSTSNQAQPSAPSPAEKPANDAAQAKRDVAAALDKSASAANDKAAASPVTETKLAQDQWLRRIPDDPGGLLRRKFMIEHMIRQQGEQQ